MPSSTARGEWPEDGAAVWSQNQPTATKEPSSASDIERDTPWLMMDWALKNVGQR